MVFRKNSGWAYMFVIKPFEGIFVINFSEDRLFLYNRNDYYRINDNIGRLRSNRNRL